MTISDYSVLLFLAAAAMLVPRSLRMALMLLGLSTISAAIAFATGNTELLIALAGVLGALLLGLLSVGVSVWRYQWSILSHRRLAMAALKRHQAAKAEWEPEQLRVGPAIS